METFIIFGMTLSVLWVALCLLLIISLISEAHESGWWATLGFVGFCFALYFWDKNVFSQIVQKIWVYAPIYLGIGFVFALIKFFFYGRKNGQKLKELRERWKRDNKVEEMTEELEKNFLEDYSAKKIINPDDFKANAFRYWLNWPGSLIWWVLSDILKYSKSTMKT